MHSKLKAVTLFVVFALSISVNPMLTKSLDSEEKFIHYSDQTETDADGDGYTNDEEIECMSDTNDPDSIPIDSDGDGLCDHLDAFRDDPTETLDTDGDGIGNNADRDDDNDGFSDDNDDYPLEQCLSTDTDGDGFPDSVNWGLCEQSLTLVDQGYVIDMDDDNDGVLDTLDAFPLDPCGSLDTDGDGLPNDIHTSINYPCKGWEGDPDDDNDGYLDVDDAFPLDSTEWIDSDGDGQGNNADVNDDNDGWSDLLEFICETDHLDPLSYPLDTDGDGQCDHIDPDDDNDGIPDESDDEPFNTDGSWLWSYAAGDILRINDVVEDNDGNFLVAGSFVGNTSIAGIPLVANNWQEAFVAKFDNSGQIMWASYTTNDLRTCANDHFDITSTSTVSVVTSNPFFNTSMWVDPAGSPGVAYAPGDTKIRWEWPYLPTQSPGTIVVGDYLYSDQQDPYVYLGKVDSFDENYIYLEQPINSEVVYGSYLFTLDTQSVTTTVSIPSNLDTGLFDRVQWQESHAVANAITIDDNGDAYITGDFQGFVKFERSGIDDVIKSYNVRNEGNWIRKYQRQLVLNQLESNIQAAGGSYSADSVPYQYHVSGFPCGAFSEEFWLGKDMFVAKIDSSGEWQWAKGAGSSRHDTGDVIALDANGEFAYVGGMLNHAWCRGIVTWPDGSDCGTIGNPDTKRNLLWCEPNKHYNPDAEIPIVNVLGVYSHAGMFNGLNGVPELNGCGFYLAKIKTSNGDWRHAEEITPPIHEIDRQFYDYEPIDWDDNPCGVITVNGEDATDYECSDQFARLTGIVIDGDPERIYLTGVYAGKLVVDNIELTESTGYDNEIGFILKYNPTTKSWQKLADGCGYIKSECDIIHDIETDGVWHYYISGCYSDRMFIGKYDFTGQREWFRLFGETCAPTEIAVDDGGHAYVTGLYRLDDGIQFGDTSLPRSSPYTTQIPSQFGGDLANHGHFVARIWSNGTWDWAEDNEQYVHPYGIPNYGHPVYATFEMGQHNHPGKSQVTGGFGSSKPTGIFVDSNERVYVTGWIQGAGFFKDQMHHGTTSYWAAIDEPLLYNAPSSTQPVDGDTWDLPFLPANFTIFVLMLTAVIVQRRTYNDAPKENDAAA